MASASFGEVSSLLDEFSVQVADVSAGSETRKADELSLVLAFGVALAIMIDIVDANWRLAVLTGTDEYDQAQEEEIQNFTRGWLRGADQVAAQLDRMGETEAKVKWSEQFRRVHREARAVLTPDEQFFTADALVDLRDAAIDAHREGRTEGFDVLGD